MQVQRFGPATASPLRRVLAGLLVLATVLFVLGVTVERGSEPMTTAEVHPVTGEAGVSPVASGPAAGEAGEAHPEGAVAPTAVASTAGQVTPSEAPREMVLGVDLENPAVVAAIVLGWLVLLGTLFFLGRAGLLLSAVAALAATLFDLGEVALQLSRGNALVVALAVAVALTHAALLIGAAWALIQSQSSRPAAARPA